MSDDLAVERWTKQFHKINLKPICCSQLMHCYQADTTGLYYQCLVCKKQQFEKYKCEDYTDSNGRLQLRKKQKKNICLDSFIQKGPDA